MFSRDGLITGVIGRKLDENWPNLVVNPLYANEWNTHKLLAYNGKHSHCYSTRSPEFNWLKNSGEIVEKLYFAHSFTVSFALITHHAPTIVKWSISDLSSSASLESLSNNDGNVNENVEKQWIELQNTIAARGNATTWPFFRRRL